MSAMVTTAALASAVAASGVTMSPMSAFLVSTTASKGARMFGVVQEHARLLKRRLGGAAGGGQGLHGRLGGLVAGFGRVKGRPRDGSFSARAFLRS